MRCTWSISRKLHMNNSEKIPPADEHSAGQPSAGKKRVLVGYETKWIGGQKKEVPKYEWVSEDALPDKPGEHTLKDHRPGMGAPAQPVSREEYYRKMGIIPPEEETLN